MSASKSLQGVVQYDSAGNEITAQPVTDNGGSLTVDDGGSSVSIDDNGGSLTVDGTVTSTQGTAAAATAPWAQRLSDGTAFYKTNTDAQLPSALVGGRLDTNNGAWLGSTAPTVGQKTMVNTIPVSVASDQTAIPVVGNAANGAAASGNPVLFAGLDGSTARSVRTRSDGTLYVELSGTAVQPVLIDDNPSFTVTAGAITIGNNKSMLALVNGVSSTSVLRVREIYIVNSQTGAVTGVIARLALRRIASYTGGTALTPVSNDTNDTLNVNVTAATGSTVASESATFIQRWFLSTDEWGAGTLDVEALQATFQTHNPVFLRRDNEMRPLTLRPGQGITIKCETNSTAGAFDIVIAFTQEDP